MKLDHSSSQKIANNVVQYFMMLVVARHFPIIPWCLVHSSREYMLHEIKIRLKNTSNSVYSKASMQI